MRTNKYIVKANATNVLGDQIEDQTLAIDADTKKLCLSSYFQRHNEVLEFDNMDDAFHELLEYLNVPNKYFYEEETGYIYRLTSINEIYRTGYRISEVMV